MAVTSGRLVADQNEAKKSGPPVTEKKTDVDSEKLDQIYSQIISKIASDGRSCVATNSKSLLEQSSSALKAYLANVKVMESSAEKPVAVQLSPEYYNPQGSKVVIEKGEVILKKEKPDSVYFLVEKTIDGVMVSVRIPFSNPNYLFCAAESHAILPYKI